MDLRARARKVSRIPGFWRTSAHYFTDLAKVELVHPSGQGDCFGYRSWFGSCALCGPMGLIGLGPMGLIGLMRLMGLRGFHGAYEDSGARAEPVRLVFLIWLGR